MIITFIGLCIVAAIGYAVFFWAVNSGEDQGSGISGSNTFDDGLGMDFDTDADKEERKRRVEEAKQEVRQKKQAESDKKVAEVIENRKEKESYF